MFETILVQFSALVGFAALVSVVINILKMFGVVKDGTADKWVAGFNLAGILTLYGLRLFVPDFDATSADSAMQEMALVASYIVSYVGMLLGSKLTYIATKDLPVIGYSNSSREETKG
jgi:hypothetical protein